MVARNFEFIEGGPVKSTVGDAWDEAMYLLNNVTTDSPDGLSMDAYMWGMRGRRVTEFASRAVLDHFKDTGVISFNRVGNIEYPPVNPQ